jgi:hypothetical protein
LAMAVMLLCLLFAAGYILLGVFHMAVPGKAPAFYRAVMGRKLFARYAERFEQVSRVNWKMMGAAYVIFGLVMVWALHGIY